VKLGREGMVSEGGRGMVQEETRFRESRF